MNIVFYYQYDIIPEMGGTERATYAIACELEKNGFSCFFIARERHIVNGGCLPTDSRQFYLPDSSALYTAENESFLHNFFSSYQIEVLINQAPMEEHPSLFSREIFPEVRIFSVIHYEPFGVITQFGDVIKGNYIYGDISYIKYLLQRFLVPYYKHKIKKEQEREYRNLSSISDKVILLSERYIPAYPSNDLSRLAAIPNPLTLNPPSRHVPKEKMILVVSRHVYAIKRIDYLLQAWHLLEKSFPEWKVCILGDGPGKKFNMNSARQMNLQNVEFCGRVDPQSYYERASIVCLTSTSEGFGLVLTEGMLYGCVPIAFDSYAAVHDIIDHMQNGILVPAFRVKEYAAQLKLLMSNAVLLSRMSTQARIKAESFSSQRIGEKWKTLLQTP